MDFKKSLLPCAPPENRTLPKSNLSQWLRGLPLDMSRIHPVCSHLDPCDRSVAAAVILRQEPDEEDEEEDEGDREEDDEGEETDDGYSE